MSIGSALIASPSGPLKGVAVAPPDKSISQRALVLGALACGETRIANLLVADDVLATLNALRALGADIVREGDVWYVRGAGTGGFAAPEAVLDLGNSATGARLLLGAAATTPLVCALSGDESLCARPMERVFAPLRRMGAGFCSRDGRLPAALIGASDPLPITHRASIPSAQVKSAVLLAALNAPGTTTYVEPEPTRDHTERLLPLFGVNVARAQTDQGEAIAVCGEAELTPAALAVPGDPSAAAFPLIAALLLPGSEIRLEGVLHNARRNGLLLTLREMGADIAVVNERPQSGETVCDLLVRASALKGVDVPPARVPSMIDEYPALAIAAAFAEGETVMRGLGELRFKESDRLSALASGLSACGVRVTLASDTLTVEGALRPAGGARLAANRDHRIAMAFLVLGLAARAPVVVEGTQTIASSFPGFVSLMTALGAEIKEAA